MVPSTVSEAALIATLGPTAPSDFVQILARAKAEEVRRRSAPESVVVGADTIVVIDGDILGKPTGVEDAVLMLQRLSGRTHQVYTGVAVIAGAGSTITRAASTDVTFFELPDVDIQNYVATGEPMDKAGSYGIQEIGKRLVKECIRRLF